MSSRIFSRPRTRVYGCNYDKGESYYKPMVDNLDKKYSSRPLFSEPRTSFADEIAARRSDIGGRGEYSGPRDLDLDFDVGRSRGRGLSNHENEEDEAVYDIRGQRSTRRSMADDFASEVAATTRRFKAQASLGLDDEKQYADFRRAEDAIQEASKASRLAKSAFEEAETAFKRRSRILGEEALERFAEEKSGLTKWTKLAEDEENGISGAAGRAKQTKARLNDLESEMEEIAERQAKRERRSAALRALVSETSSANSDEILTQQSVTSKKVTVRSDKHVNF